MHSSFNLHSISSLFNSCIIWSDPYLPLSLHHSFFSAAFRLGLCLCVLPHFQSVINHEITATGTFSAASSLCDSCNEYLHNWGRFPYFICKMGDKLANLHNLDALKDSWKGYFIIWFHPLRTKLLNYFKAEKGWSSFLSRLSIFVQLTYITGVR